MRVMITGGAGFIGSHIATQLLEQGDEPVIIDNYATGNRENLPEEVRVYDADIRDRETLENIFQQERPDAVTHHAAQLSVSRSVREPAYDAEINILGWLNILECAAQYQVPRLLLASSGGTCYGNVDTPVDESFPARPQSPYGFTKLIGEHYLKFFTEQNPGMTGVSLRYANVYGPRQSFEGEAGVIAIFSSRMLNQEPVTIHGDGSAVRDFVYVEDVARANLLALKQDLPENYLALNIGTGQKTTIGELARQIREIAADIHQQRGLESEIPEPGNGPERAGDIRSNLIDSGLAKELLGWEPETDIQAGLRKTVDWFARKIPRNQA